jgi:hypothetical protein
MATLATLASRIHRLEQAAQGAKTRPVRVVPLAGLEADAWMQAQLDARVARLEAHMWYTSYGKRTFK